MKSTLLILLSGVVIASGADLSKPLATPGKLLFADDFERAELGKDWKQVIGTFGVRDGVMVGSQTRADHGAVGRVSVPMKDAVVEFRFQLAGSTGVNCVFDDRTYKGSHAGHICRVALTPRQIRLGDDKEGVMRNDIFEMRRDPQRKKAADKLLVGRGTAIKASLKQNQWYQVRIEIVEDEMRVSLDGKAIGRLQSAGLAHPTKSSFHFTVNGKDALFDDVKIWSAAPVSSN
jgi:hypothetical protein